MSLNNLDASAEIYVSLAATGASAPGVGSTDNDVVVPPRSSRQFALGPGIELWLRASGTTPAPYTALEAL